MKTKNPPSKQETIWADFQMPNEEDPYLKEINNLAYYSKHFDIIVDHDSGMRKSEACKSTITVYSNVKKEVLELVEMKYASLEQTLNKFLELKNKWILDYDQKLEMHTCTTVSWQTCLNCGCGLGFDFKCTNSICPKLP
jgi:hypothetical protein